MKNSSVGERNLEQITAWEATGTPSFYRNKIYEPNERGYCSIQLDEKLMGILNQSNGVRETLSNLVRFTSSSNFVFQQENNAKIELSKTRCLLIQKF
jgi:hypothetical protein